jgi:predicted ribosomally synthesized peptide with nif11-like leader
MSRQSFEAFMSTLNKDGSLQKELREQLGDPAQGVSAEGLNQFAASKGYDFKVEEIKGELSEKQLDTVAGGLLSGSPSFSSFYKVESSLLQTQYIKFDYNFQKF